MFSSRHDRSGSNRYQRLAAVANRGTINRPLLSAALPGMANGTHEPRVLLRQPAASGPCSARGFGDGGGRLRHGPMVGGGAQGTGEVVMHRDRSSVQGESGPLESWREATPVPPSGTRPRTGPRFLTPRFTSIKRDRDGNARGQLRRPKGEQNPLQQIYGPSCLLGPSGVSGDHSSHISLSGCIAMRIPVTQ